MFKFKIPDHPFDFLLIHTLAPLIPAKVKPNHLTVLRFILIPPVVWLMLSEKYGWGLLLFLFAALTDGLDGVLARHRNQETELGKILDPLADKLLIASVIFVVVIIYISYWLALVIVALECLIIVGAMIQNKKGVHPQANRWGKTKMFLQVLGVSLLLLSLIFQLEYLVNFSTSIFYLSVIFAIISLITHGI